MAKPRNTRAQHLNYKGLTISSWTPSPRLWAASILEGGFNDVYGSARSKVVKQLKTEIDKHLDGAGGRP